MERRAERQVGYLYLGFLNRKNDFKNREYFHKDGNFFYINTLDKYGTFDSNLTDYEKSLCSDYMTRLKDWNEQIAILYSLVRNVSPEELKRVKTHLNNRKNEREERKKQLMVKETQKYRIPNPTDAFLREQRDSLVRQNVRDIMKDEFLELTDRLDYGEEEKRDVEKGDRDVSLHPPPLPYPPDIFPYSTGVENALLYQRQKMDTCYVRSLINKWNVIRNSVMLEQLVRLFSTYNMFHNENPD